MKGWRPPRSPKAARARARRVSWITAGALVLYVTSYVAFSTWGQYVGTRATLPSQGTLLPRYEWAPGEFFDYSDSTWRRSHLIVFYPLWWLDNRFWHTAKAAQSGQYPVLAPSSGR